MRTQKRYVPTRSHSGITERPAVPLAGVADLFEHHFGEIIYVDGYVPVNSNQTDLVADNCSSRCKEKVSSL